MTAWLHTPPSIFPKSNLYYRTKQNRRPHGEYTGAGFADSECLFFKEREWLCAFPDRQEIIENSDRLFSCHAATVSRAGVKPLR